MVQAVEEFKLSYPAPRYPALRSGFNSGHKSRLDLVLEACGIEYQKYVLYIEAYMVSLASSLSF